MVCKGNIHMCKLCDSDNEFLCSWWIANVLFACTMSYASEIHLSILSNGCFLKNVPENGLT